MEGIFSNEAGVRTTPIRDLKLAIAGTRLEPMLLELTGELERAGVRVRPHFYLSTEWGVPFETISIAIPFYLAHPVLTGVHRDRMGHVEGIDRRDVLRYLRHEMGHVVNYAYRLYDQPEWVRLFGPITRPYVEEYRPKPFSRRFVRHLPGWYAQKHPDEDWAETFAVWLTPGLDWRTEYFDAPAALEKLVWCEKTMRELSTRDPLVTATELDEDVAELPYSVDEFYVRQQLPVDLPHGLDGTLRALFEDHDHPEDELDESARLPASELLLRLEKELVSNVFRWTGHFPERTRPLLRHLAQRADELKQVYPASREDAMIAAISTMLTALAMNWIRHGSYLP
ncbi:MAG TPA: putative zinc-binding metallopeptidase [Planctomycetota bacterium]|nr:putative zinc-binding metallopeptidase [Planctomycetota bacterium]